VETAGHSEDARHAVLPVRASPTAVLLAAAGTYVVRAAAPLVVSVLISFLAALRARPDRPCHRDARACPGAWLAGTGWSAKRLNVDVLRSIDRQIKRYLVVCVLISAIVAVVAGVVLWLLGLRHAVSWGLVAGVLNALPFIGPGAAAIGATAVAALDGNVLTPWLTGRAGELNTVAVFAGIMFWGWMWGVWGLVLAVPILVAVKAAANRIEPLQPIGELLER